MFAIALLIAYVLAGILVARLARPPAALVPALNGWAINVALPALILKLVPHVRFTTDLWFLPIAMWVVFFGACGLFLALGRALSWSKERIGAVTLVSGLGNTSFIGYPLIATLRGQEALDFALMADQLGTFVMLSIGGACVAAAYSGARISTVSIATKVVSFPPFMALVIGALLNIAGGWPAGVEAILDVLGRTLIPVTLFSVGLQLRFALARTQVPAIALSLTWKLIFAPALLFAFGSFARVQRPILEVAVLQAAMAPMVTAAILADRSNLEPELANIILGLGIFLSFATVPLISMLLRV